MADFAQKDSVKLLVTEYIWLKMFNIFTILPFTDNIFQIWYVKLMLNKRLRVSIVFYSGEYLALYGPYSLPNNSDIMSNIAYLY